MYCSSRVSRTSTFQSSSVWSPSKLFSGSEILWDWSLQQRLTSQRQLSCHRTTILSPESTSYRCLSTCSDYELAQCCGIKENGPNVSLIGHGGQKHISLHVCNAQVAISHSRECLVLMPPSKQPQPGLRFASVPRIHLPSILPPRHACSPSLQTRHQSVPNPVPSSPSQRRTRKPPRQR